MTRFLFLCWGSLVTVDLVHRSVTTQVAHQKATKWADLLELHRQQSEMSSTMALKMAGRLDSADIIYVQGWSCLY